MSRDRPVHGNFKRKLVLASTVLALVAFAGGAFAATQTTTNPRQAFLNDVAKRLGVAPQQLSAALKGAALDQLQAAVKAGRLTQAQANLLRQRIEQGKTIGPFGPGYGWKGPGLRGLEPFGPPPPGRPPALGVGPSRALTGAASYLGMSVAQLARQLASGKALAQIASSKGKSVAGLEASLENSERARLDKLVAAKLITKAQEQQILKAMAARLAVLVNRRGFGPPLRFRGGFAAPPMLPARPTAPAPPSAPGPPYPPGPPNAPAPSGSITPPRLPTPAASPAASVPPGV